MKIHEVQHDLSGAGRWHKATGRYIPITGGWRSRLPIYAGDSEIRRYYGFVGIDERLTETIFTISTLFQHIGGAPKIQAGAAGTLTSRIQDVKEEQLKAEAEEAAAAAKAAQLAQLTQPQE
jgi:hypothetical protein